VHKILNLHGLLYLNCKKRFVFLGYRKRLLLKFELSKIEKVVAATKFTS